MMGRMLQSLLVYFGAATDDDRGRQLQFPSWANIFSECEMRTSTSCFKTKCRAQLVVCVRFEVWMVDQPSLVALGDYSDILLPALLRCQQ
jgi:hypothetical protein